MEPLTFAYFQSLENKKCAIIKEELFSLTRKCFRGEVDIPKGAPENVPGEYILFWLFTRVYSAYALEFDETILKGRP